MEQSISTVTARDYCGDTARMIVMYPAERRLEYKTQKPEDGERFVEKFDYDRTMTEIKRWLFSVGPDDVTYHSSFDSSSEYEAWKAELLPVDSDSAWEITIEYENNGIAAFICEDVHPFPKIFEEICDYAERNSAKLKAG